MRTTLTLDPDVEALIRKAMRERGVSFKEAVNDAIRAGLLPRQRKDAHRTRTFSMGEPSVPLDRALALAGDLEDEAILHKLETRK